MTNPYSYQLIRLALVIGLLSMVSPVVGQNINTFAGTGTSGYTGDGGPATSAQIFTPYGVAVASNGDVYFADRDNNVIRKVDNATGDISTVAGGGSLQTGDGNLATAAWTYMPHDIAVDGAGNMYIADTFNHRIRKVDIGTGLISTIAGTGVQGYGGDGGVATAALLDTPSGIDVDSGGNIIFSDTNNHRIRKITPGGTISTIAGTGGQGSSGDGGLATAAKVKFPHGISIDDSDNIYIADTNNSRIRKFTDGGTINTIAGTGQSGYAGDGGTATAAKINRPKGLWVVDNGASDSIFGFNTIFGSTQSGVHQKQIATQVTVAQDGIVDSITAYQQGGKNKKVRYAIYTDSVGEPDALIVETITVTRSKTAAWLTIDLPPTSLTAGTYWLALAFNASSEEYYYDAVGGQTRYSDDDATANGYTANWGVTTTTNSRRISIYAAIHTDPNDIYIADTANDRIRKFTEYSTIESIAGTGTAGYSGDGGPATAAQIDTPEHVAVDSAGDVYIGDTLNHRIRKIDFGTGDINTYGGTGTAAYSGDGGPATSADMNEPRGLFVDASDDLFLADSQNHIIRKITSGTGVITTVAGTPRDPGMGDGGLATIAFLQETDDVAVDAAGNLYIVCLTQARVRKVDFGTGIITTLIGSGIELAPADPNDDVMLLSPSGVAVDSVGNVYVADRDALNSRIVKYTAVGPTYETFAGNGIPGSTGDGGLATAAKVNRPQGVAVDSNDDVYIADTGSASIRKVVVSTGIITNVAGSSTVGYSGDGGLATAADMNTPTRVVIDATGKFYIADSGNSVIRKVTASGYISTIAGNAIAGFSGDGGDATLAQLNLAVGVGFKDGDPGVLYIADTVNHRIRDVDVPLITSRIVSWQEVEP